MGTMDSSADTKERIRQAVDIVDLVGSSIALRRQGNMFVGLCPFHSDSKPSLQVRQDRQTWKCWVCGDKGGDIFSWVMEWDKVDFKDALKLLADRAGIKLEQRERKPTIQGDADDKKTLLACCTWAEQEFHEHLLKSESAEVARKYLADRKISAESIAKFKLGFAPNDRNWLIERARRANFSPAVLEGVDLLAKSPSDGRLYERFRGRVMFPIRSTEGRCIAFGGRILPQFDDGKTGKYVNSRETLLFSKSNQLYALDKVRDNIRQSKSLTVVEGYTDVIMCHQNGVNDVVACLGTALGERHLSLIKRFADTVYLILDGDEAGQKSANRVLEIFVAAQFDLRIATLPDQCDPDEYLQEHSSEEWYRFLEANAVDALEHRIRTAKAGVDTIRDTFKANAALEEILETLALAPKPTITSAGAQQLREQQILTRLAREFAIELATLNGRLNELRKTTRFSAAPTPAPAASIAPVLSFEVPRASQVLAVEAELIELLVRFPELAPTALAELADGDISSAAVRYLFQLYRRLEEAGEALDFSRVLSEIEDPRLQNFLVEFDERAERKLSPEVQKNSEAAEPAALMRGVINLFHRHHLRTEQLADEAELARLDSQLKNSGIDQSGDVAQVGDQHMEKLLEVLNKKRQQQGIIAPTDG